MSNDNTIDALRAVLFEQIRAVRQADGEAAQGVIAKARAVSELAGRIVDTAKVEIDYAKATQQTTSGQFFGVDQGAPQLGMVGAVGPAETTRTPTGTKTTQMLANGSAVTTHKLR